MSKLHRARSKTSLDKARLFGLGALFVGALTGCADQSSPAPAEAPVTASAQNVAATPQPEPSTAPSSTAAEPTSAPAATSEPTALPSPTAIPPTETPAATPTEMPTETPTETPVSTGRYKDGEYLGAAVRADRWGNMQVRATIEGGQLVKIDIVEYPRSTRRSDLISRAALPTLVSEAIENQDADVDIVSRATDTCVAFEASLESALNEAAAGDS